MLRPPQRVTVSESAAKNLRIVNPSGAGGGWSPEVAPYMVEPMNLARSRLHEAIIFAGPARSGKTVALVDGVVAYSIVDDPADIMIVQTNQSQAEDFSKTRIGRGISGSPELAKRLSPRAHDDNVLLKFFRSGMAIRFGWPSLSQLSGKDLRRMLLTDVDNFSGDLSIDEAFGLALKRTQTYMSAGILIAESSPAKDYLHSNWRPSTEHEAPPAGGILSLYNRGDRRRWYWPCPECKQPFQAEPGIAQFRLPPIEDLVERAVVDDILVMSERWSILFCPHCNVGIEAKHKRNMNLAGRWVAEGQKMWPDGTVTGERLRSRTASFWLGGVAAAYQPWSSLIERYLQAVKQYALTGEQRQLKTTINVDQAMPFLPMTGNESRDSNKLHSRAESWTQDHVPVGVRFLTASIDIQKNRFVIQVMGWGRQLEHWIVDRYSLHTSTRCDANGTMLPLDPAAFLEDWERLIEKVITRRYPLDDNSGRSMPVLFVTSDSGGKLGVTTRAYDFWRSLKQRNLHRRFRLVKGASTDKAPRVEETYPDTRKRKGSASGASGDVPVLMVNTTIIKDAIASNLGRTTPGPGYIHFPSWLPISFYDELTAETRGAKRWENLSKARNESFDLAVYGYVAALQMKADVINWDDPPAWAADWDKNSEINRNDAVPVVPISRGRVRNPGIRL